MRFETLVDAGGCDYAYHKNNGIVEKPPDVAPDTGSKDPVELVNDLLIAYLQTSEFREAFGEYVKNSCTLLERR